MSKGVHRLLIYFAGIGDLVFLVPLFRRLAETGPLELVTRPWGEPLFSCQPFVAHTHVLAHPNRGKKGLAKTVLGYPRERLGKELGARGFDEIIIFKQERAVIREWVESWRGSAKVAVMTYPDRAPDRRVIGIESLGMAADGMETAPRLKVTAESRGRARERLATLGTRVVAVKTGAGPVNGGLMRRFNVKGLTADQWAGLITHVLRQRGADAIVFLGTAKESRDVPPIAQRVPAELRSRLHDWSGEVRLDALLPVLAECRALLSVDTGPAHIAAAVGCPLLVCFGPTDPAAYLMRGPAPTEMVQGSAPCQFCNGTPRFKTCRDNICMQSLTADEMTAGWERLNARIAG